MMKLVFALTFLAAIAVSGCASAPFSYAENRCTGGYNQCSSACSSARDPAAEAACQDRCLAHETTCSDTAADAGSLAESTAIGAAQSQRKKEADYHDWLRARAKEAAPAK